MIDMNLSLISWFLFKENSCNTFEKKKKRRAKWPASATRIPVVYLSISCHAHVRRAQLPRVISRCPASGTVFPHGNPSVTYIHTTLNQVGYTPHPCLAADV